MHVPLHRAHISWPGTAGRLCDCVFSGDRTTWCVCGLQHMGRLRPVMHSAQRTDCDLQLKSTNQRKSSPWPTAHLRRQLPNHGDPAAAASGDIWQLGLNVQGAVAIYPSVAAANAHKLVWLVGMPDSRMKSTSRGRNIYERLARLSLQQQQSPRRQKHSAVANVHSMVSLFVPLPHSQVTCSSAGRHAACPTVYHKNKCQAPPVTWGQTQG